MEKKNYFWSLLAMIMVTLTSVGFVSCGDDDDDDSAPATSSSLVGLWQMTNIKGWYIDEDTDKKVNFNTNVSENDHATFDALDVADFVRYQFDANNTFTCYVYSSDEWQFDNTAPYVLSGKVLNLGKAGDYDYEQLTIVSLTSNTLVLKMIEDGEFEIEATMKRIH